MGSVAAIAIGLFVGIMYVKATGQEDRLNEQVDEIVKSIKKKIHEMTKE